MTKKSHYAANQEFRRQVGCPDFSQDDIVDLYERRSDPDAYGHLVNYLTVAAGACMQKQRTYYPIKADAEEGISVAKSWVVEAINTWDPESHDSTLSSYAIGSVRGKWLRWAHKIDGVKVRTDAANPDDKYYHDVHVVSMQTPVGDEGLEFGSSIMDVEPDIATLEVQGEPVSVDDLGESLQASLKKLSPKELVVVNLHFFEDPPMSYEAISKDPRFLALTEDGTASKQYVGSIFKSAQKSLLSHIQNPVAGRPELVGSTTGADEGALSDMDFD